MAGIESAPLVIDEQPAAPWARRASASGPTRHPLSVYVVRRVIILLLTLLGVSFLSFAAMELLPGDVASRVLGRNATPQAVAELTQRLGLDRPFLERYLDWLGSFVTGHFGPLTTSAGESGRTVNDAIASEGLNSVMLAGATLVLLVPLTVLAGSIAAVNAHRWPDRVISVVSMVFVSVPEFVVGTVLIYVLAIRAQLLPPLSLLDVGQTPLQRPEVLVLPVLTLLLGMVAFAGRFVRAGLIDVLRSEYVQAARLNGFPERRVVWRVALRSSLVPMVQLMALMVPYLVGGLIIIETVFSYPGIGSLFSAAVLNGDVRLVQAVAVLGAAITLSSNLFGDLLVMVLVPKLRPGVAR